MGDKIGVFICHCGGNISDVVDVKDVIKFSESLEDVVFVDEHEHLCSDEGQKLILSSINEKNLDRVVVGSCSPYFHEETFRETLRKSEINSHMLEIANLREQCSWVHYNNPDGATEKAKAMIAGAVEKVKRNEDLEPPSIPIGKRVLIIGAGIAGIQSALDLADAGFDVIVVEKEPTIGGRMAQLSRTFPTNDCAPCILSPKMSDLISHDNVKVYTNTDIEGIRGTVGNFDVEVTVRPRYVDEKKCTACGKCTTVCPTEVENEFNFGLDKRKAVYIPHIEALPKSYLIDIEKCIKPPNPPCKRVCPADAIDFDQKEKKKRVSVDAIIIATGYDLFDLSKISEYRYGYHKNIIHAAQLERMIIGTGPTAGKIIRPSDRKTPKSIAFVLCAGSRDKKYCEYCSKICCMYSMKEASILRDILGNNAKISIFYTDIRAAGKGYEEYYNDVQKKGIRFINGKPSEIVGANNSNLIVKAEDTKSGRILEEEFEMVVLAPAIVPKKEAEIIKKTLKLPTGLDGFFKEEHPKFKPVDTSVSGVFIAGCAQGPKDISETVQQGSAAASRANRLLSQGFIEVQPLTVSVDKELCDNCMDCVDVCPYGALAPKNGKVKVHEVLCRGCGLCLGSCHANALSITNYKRDQILSQIKGMLSVVSKPVIIAFLDNVCSYKAVDSLSNRRVFYPSNILPVRVPDGAMIDSSLILDTFKLGADGVCVSTCEAGSDPYSPECAKVTAKNVETAREKLNEIGVNDNRLSLIHQVSGTPMKFLKSIESLEKIIEAEGSLKKNLLEDTCK